MDTSPNSKDKPLDAGTIVVVHASISHPVHLLIAEEVLPGSTSWHSRQNTINLSRQSLLSALDPRRVKEKLRPAVCVDDPVSVASDKRKICLMGTLEGNDISQFPAMLQNFLVPLHPNTKAPEPLHTQPEWRGTGADQWIVAIAFHLKGQSLDVPYSRADDDSTYHMDDEQLAHLMALCTIRRNTFLSQSRGKREKEARRFRVIIHDYDMI